MTNQDGSTVRLSFNNWVALITLALAVIIPTATAWISINNKVAVISNTLDHHKEAINKIEVAVERNRQNREKD